MLSIFVLLLSIDQSDYHFDPLTEGLKLVNEENQRLQNELNEMHRKFERLDTRKCCNYFKKLTIKKRIISNLKVKDN